MTRFAFALAAAVSALALASAAQAADLIIDEPAPTVGIVDVGGNWDGVYIGAFAGYGAGTFEWSDTADVEGWLLGAAVGANFTVTDGIVAGVVGDIAWSDIGDDDGFFDINWAGSLRGRLGFDGGAFLPYLTAGLAVAGTEIEGIDATHIGWTAGAGVEFAATEDLSVDLLYRYSDYGTQSYNGTDVSLNTHQVTIGLNWHF
jgi:outer membrane immunogenic protein